MKAVALRWHLGLEISDDTSASAAKWRSDFAKLNARARIAFWVGRSRPSRLNWGNYHVTQLVQNSVVLPGSQKIRDRRVN